jgi:hypothetical protein
VPNSELRVLLHYYKASYTAYMSCVHALSEAAVKEEWPSADLLGKEERALQQLNYARQALLDALYALTHSNPRGGGGSLPQAS